MSLQALSSVLWRERQLLELLLFKLEEEQLLLTSGKTRWLGHATREVENVLEQIREVELGRSVESDAVARLHGLEPGRSLHELSEAVPAPWDDLLRTHRQAFLDITHQLDMLDLFRAINREHGTTVVAVLHDLNQAARYADRIVAMRDGEIARTGRPHEVLTPEVMQRVFDLDCTVIADPETGTPMVVPRRR